MGQEVRGVHGQVHERSQGAIDLASWRVCCSSTLEDILEQAENDVDQLVAVGAIVHDSKIGDRDPIKCCAGHIFDLEERMQILLEVV